MDECNKCLDECRCPPERCDSTWIQTFTGRQFWPLNPRAEDIDIRDIAHALSNICRFTGHTRWFYSVAQHSVIASHHCEDPMWALLHDASEAYLCDIARPLKRSPEFSAYRNAESRMMQVIAERFVLPWPEPAFIKQIDLVMLATERRDLMPHPPRPWLSIENVKPLAQGIQPWSPARAEFEFLDRFEQLNAKAGA